MSLLSANLDAMKMDFLLHIQTNQYQVAFEISKQILQLDPKNALILKFSKFLHEYRGKMKQMDDQKFEKVQTVIEEDSNPVCESDSELDSNYSISASEDSSEDEMEFEKPKQIGKVEIKEKGKEKCKMAVASTGAKKK